MSTEKLKPWTPATYRSRKEVEQVQAGTITSNTRDTDQLALDLVLGRGHRMESQSVGSVEKLDTFKADVSREHKAVRENPRVLLKMDNQCASIVLNQDTDGKTVSKDLHSTSIKTKQQTQTGEEDSRHVTER